MRFAYSPVEEQFRTEVREFLAEHMTPNIVERLGLANTPEHQEFLDKVAARGWFGLGWPEPYGGVPGTRTMRMILNEELAYAGAPNIGIAVLAVGSAILEHASEELKDEFLPGILRHQILFAYGYTEPHGGSDLASLRTTAIRDGDVF